jgi:hypothetical protein
MNTAKWGEMPVADQHQTPTENGKEKEAAAGDYLVWAQLLKEAGDRGCDVLFVTRDLKEAGGGTPRQG